MYIRCTTIYLTTHTWLQDHFREFDYDMVIGPDVRQEAVYAAAAAPLVEVRARLATSASHSTYPRTHFESVSCISQEVLKGSSSTLLAYPPFTHSSARVQDACLSVNVYGE